MSLSTRRASAHLALTLAALALPVAFSLSAALPAEAAGAPPATYFPNDATINYVISGQAVVGYADQTDASNGTNYTNPTVTIVPGGSVGYVVSDNASTINLNGGTVATLNSENSGTVNVRSGMVTTILNGFSTSTVNVSGGTIASLGLNNQGMTTISGGTIAALDAAGTDKLLITGGSLTGGVDTALQPAVSIRGGTFGLVSDGSNNTFDVNFADGTTGGFTLYGSGLTAADIGKSTNGLGEDYLLTGRLQDGSSVTGDKIQVQGPGVTFTLVNAAPEPSPFAVLSIGIIGLGALAMKAKRRTA